MEKNNLLNSGIKTNLFKNSSLPLIEGLSHFKNLLQSSNNENNYFYFKCLLTKKEIKIPARGNECKHIECFDKSYLESYLKEKDTLSCPKCGKLIFSNSLVVDNFLWTILKFKKISECENKLICIEKSTGKWKLIYKDFNSEDKTINHDLKVEHLKNYLEMINKIKSIKKDEEDSLFKIPNMIFLPGLDEYNEINKIEFLEIRNHQFLNSIPLKVFINFSSLKIESIQNIQKDLDKYLLLDYYYFLKSIYSTQKDKIIFKILEMPFHIDNILNFVYNHKNFHLKDNFEIKILFSTDEKFFSILTDVFGLGENLVFFINYLKRCIKLIFGNQNEVKYSIYKQSNVDWQLKNISEEDIIKIFHQKMGSKEYFCLKFEIINKSKLLKPVLEKNEDKIDMSNQINLITQDKKFNVLKTLDNSNDQVTFSSLNYGFTYYNLEILNMNSEKIFAPDYFYCKLYDEIKFFIQIDSGIYSNVKNNLMLKNYYPVEIDYESRIFPKIIFSKSLQQYDLLLQFSSILQKRNIFLTNYQEYLNNTGTLLSLKILNLEELNNFTELSIKSSYKVYFIFLEPDVKLSEFKDLLKNSRKKFTKIENTTFDLSCRQEAKENMVSIDISDNSNNNQYLEGEFEQMPQNEILFEYTDEELIKYFFFLESENQLKLDIRDVLEIILRDIFLRKMNFINSLKIKNDTYLVNDKILYEVRKVKV
jgi:hypothetical protein